MTESQTPTKSPFKSKTVWTNLLMAVLAFFPGINDFVVENPQTVIILFTVVNLILRAVTKDKIQLLSIMLLFTLSAMGCACLQVDTAMAAVAGGEPTVFLEGCGSQIQNGLLGVQIMEGASPDCELHFFAPPAKCDRESCAGFQFGSVNGTPGFGMGVPKGETQVSFKLSDVVGHDRPLTQADEAVYTMHAGVYFKNQDGLEELMRTKGHLHLIVLKEGYKPMGCGSPERAWRFEVSEDCHGEVSTGYRAALCGEGCAG
jgi:hypothetical protein